MLMSLLRRDYLAPNWIVHLGSRTHASRLWLPFPIAAPASFQLVQLRISCIYRRLNFLRGGLLLTACPFSPEVALDLSWLRGTTSHGVDERDVDSLG
jgi:hypothetical protein